MLEHSRIVHVRRAGKHIVFDLEAQGHAEGKKASSERRGQWIVHLGMTGQLLIGSPEAEMAKHTHAVLKLKSGRELRFVDMRRFGRLSVVRLDSEKKLVSERQASNRWTSIWNISSRSSTDARLPSKALC